VYYAAHYHLGDLWVGASWLCEHARGHGSVSLCEETWETEHWGSANGDQMIGDLVRRMLALLRGGGAVSVIPGHRETDLRIPGDGWDAAICRTRTQWNPTGGSIAYQLAGSRYRARLKNLPDMARERIVERIREMGYRGVEVGLPLTLEESVEEIAKADLFIGIDSGMTHVAYSVGAPVALLKNKVPWSMLECHHQRYACVFRGADALLRRLTRPFCGQLVADAARRMAEEPACAG